MRADWARWVSFRSQIPSDELLSQREGVLIPGGRWLLDLLLPALEKHDATVTQVGIADEVSFWYVHLMIEGQTFHLDVSYFGGIGNVRVAVYPHFLSWVLRRDHTADLLPFVEVVSRVFEGDPRVREVTVGTEFVAP